MGGNWEALHDEHIIRTLALASCKCLESIPNPTSLLLKQLCRTWALVHIRECARTICTLVLNTLVAPSNETTRVLRLFHPLAKVDLSLFINDFHLNMKVILGQEAFVYVLVCSPRFSYNGPLHMLYELLWDCFVPNDFVNGFKLSFEICEHIAWNHVPPLILCLHPTFRLLTLEK
jgi:hypothetical protein